MVRREEGPEWLEWREDTPGTGTLKLGTPFNILNIISPKTQHNEIGTMTSIL